jgi:lipopolysaccharide transport system ATP-binding protein
MALAFRRVSRPPFRDFEAAAPDGAVIGIVGEDGAGKGLLLRLAAGIDRPLSGSIEASGAVRLLGPDEALELPAVPVVLIDHTFARHDLAVRERSALALEHLCRAGSTVLLVSHEEELLLRLADEVWWLAEGRLAGRGDPAETLAAYRRHISARVRAAGIGDSAAMAPRMRRGDGRAEVMRIEMSGEDGRPTIVWRSGELALVKVRVRFREAVADPVVGIMIRTRGGLNVYGTNTELERLKLGPCAAGETIEISFGFRCELCPQEYTLTVASHDPDGVWHDWLEDAVAFSVTDDRYTAGVANLRATARLTRAS